jgi:histidyl-tRNA synthetase
LFELIGGKPAPAVGWGMGIERVLDLLQQEGLAPAAPSPMAYAVVPDAHALPRAVVCVEALRAAGLSVQLHAGGKDGLGSMKSQFKKADASGARYALVFGSDELARGEVAIKPLRDAGAAQTTRALGAESAWAAELLHA